MKRFKFLFVSILSIVLVAFLGSLCACSLGQPTIKNNLKYWENNDYSELQYGSRLNEILPVYAENNSFISANFFYHKGCLSFEYAEAAYCLELQLNESDYNVSKENAEKNYNFLEEVNLENEELILTDYKAGKFDTKFISLNDSVFAHEIGLIAFEDSCRIIRYCYIVDMSLDYFEDETDLTNWITNNLNIGW